MWSSGTLTSLEERTMRSTKTIWEIQKAPDSGLIKISYLVLKALKGSGRTKMNVDLRSTEKRREVKDLSQKSREGPQ